MKIVVIGGSGLIGSRLVANLRALGHEAVAASPHSDVDRIQGREEIARRGASAANV